MNTVRALNDLRETVKAAPDIPEPTKKKIDEQIDKALSPLQTDKWIYRLVVCFLGVAAVVTVIGGIVIACKSTGGASLELPGGIVAIGSAAVGALAGLLAPSPKQG